MDYSFSILPVMAMCLLTSMVSASQLDSNDSLYALLGLNAPPASSNTNHDPLCLLPYVLGPEVLNDPPNTIMPIFFQAVADTVHILNDQNSNNEAMLHGRGESIEYFRELAAAYAFNISTTTGNNTLWPYSNVSSANETMETSQIVAEIHNMTDAEISTFILQAYIEDEVRAVPAEQQDEYRKELLAQEPLLPIKDRLIDLTQPVRLPSRFLYIGQRHGTAPDEQPHDRVKRVPYNWEGVPKVPFYANSTRMGILSVIIIVVSITGLVLGMRHHQKKHHHVKHKGEVHKHSQDHTAGEARAVILKSSDTPSNNSEPVRHAALLSNLTSIGLEISEENIPVSFPANTTTPVWSNASHSDDILAAINDTSAHPSSNMSLAIESDHSILQPFPSSTSSILPSSSDSHSLGLNTTYQPISTFTTMLRPQSLLHNGNAPSLGWNFTAATTSTTLAG